MPQHLNVIEWYFCMLICKTVCIESWNSVIFAWSDKVINTSISMQQDARTCFSTFLPVLCGDDPSVRWGHHLRSIFACIRSCTANHAKNKKKIEKQHQSKLRFEKKEWGKGITKSKATEIPYKWKNVDVNLLIS